MANYFYKLLLLACIVSSCQTMQELSIDYMVPADISFPPQLRKVGVVNNTTSLSVEPPAEEMKQAYINMKLFYPLAQTSAATESLAKAIAEGNYFDEVVICDSALRANDIHVRENTLSKTEVNELAELLNVDFLVSLEELRLMGKRTIRPDAFVNAYRATIDMKVFPTVNIYVPNRAAPLATIMGSDSIFWESIGASEGMAQSRLIKESLVVDEASEFAGTVPVKYMLPYWKSAYRYYYAGGTVNMRDAAIYVREDAWEKAYELWNKDLQTTKNKKKQMYLSHNIALYYEMSDQLEEAEQWAAKAKKLAAEVEKVSEEQELDLTTAQLPAMYLTPYPRATLYLKQIQARKEEMTRLNAQMGRFNDDF